jgi:hypothetical protein
MNTLFTFLIFLQFGLILLHDLIDIPGLVSGSSVRSSVGKGKLIGVTLVNAIFPGIAAGLAIFFLNRNRPPAVWNYWLIYCGITVCAAFFMWYLPYIRGAVNDQSGAAAKLHQDTVHVLPLRGDNAGPDLFHMCMHILFLANFCLVCLLRYWR